MDKITFVIPSRNNLDLLKLSYKSIRRLKTNHEILVLNDASVDGTQEWLDSLDDDNLVVHTNLGPERVGIVGMFDKGIEMATTDIIFAFHADMVAGSNLDINILKHLERGKVVTATRIEPPLHPNGPEKHIEDFGIEPEDFAWDRWVNENTSFEQKTITNGIFAPWCMYKEDFLKVGGHDDLFAPQSREDSDLFNRFVLNGYELIQSWDALVYHFTSRGSRFNKFAGGDTGKDSPEWKQTNNKNERNFFRKWGGHVKHDPYMFPIVTPKYDIGFTVKNCNGEMIQHLEPLCSTLYVDTFAEDYINNEQDKTTLDLTKRIYSIDAEKQNDIEVRFDLAELTNDGYKFLQNLPEIIQDSGEVGSMAFDCFEIEIHKLKNYNSKHVKLSEDNKIVQGLWIGGELSNLEKLSIQSYIDNGHEFHLYTYDDVKGVPSEAIDKDGNDIISKSELFFYTTPDHYGSYSAFSNWFRYKLLLEKGGWWSDMDMICLKPLNFPNEHTFSSEFTGEGDKHITSGLIKAPVGSEVMKYCWDKTQEIGKEIKWGQIGPRLVKEAVENFKLENNVEEPTVFCPTHYEDMESLIGTKNPNIQTHTHTIHFWNETWRTTNRNKDDLFDENCLYEVLKKRYHIGR